MGGRTMDEFIKREAAIAIIEEKQKELCPVGRYGRGYVYGSDREKYDAWDEIIDALENIPSADVVPVVHGRWVGSKYDPETGDYMEKCSRCGVFSREYWKPHCSECGALMDGGGNDETD